MKHFPPLREEIIYISDSAINECALYDKSSILVKVVGAPYNSNKIANGIHSTWDLEDSFFVHKVVKQSYKVSFCSIKVFDEVTKKRWHWIDLEFAIIRIWEQGIYLIEDPLDSVPQFILLHNIPPNLWSPKSIGRICSTMGSPISP